MDLKVAIVGRPNVGKSTLFNRLVGFQSAITAEEAGTTRDRKSGICTWEGREIEVTDTAGWEKVEREDLIMNLAMEQIRRATEEADLIFLVMDAREGLTELDKVFANELRKYDKEIILLANKVEGSRQAMASEEFKGLGFPVYAISATTGNGVGDLLDHVFSRLKEKKAVAKKRTPKIAIVGRPNVGKSTLINRLLGEERVIVSEIPGTTRDRIDVLFKYQDQEVILVDTAGIRKRGKIKVGAERFGVERSLKAIEGADKVALILDAIAGPTRQDAHIAQYALEAKKKILVVYNKCDMLENGEVPNFYRFPFLSRLPYTFVSAQTGENLEELLQFMTR